VAVVSVAPAAAAQTADPKAQARELYGQGIERYDRGDFEGAAKAYKQAYALVQYPVILFNLALAYESSGKPVDAVSTLEKVLAAPGKLKPERVAKAKQSLDTQRKLVAELDVSCNVEGATIRIDGEEVGSFPLPQPVKVASGRVILQATKDGYAAGYKTVTAPGGGGNTVANLAALGARPVAVGLVGRDEPGDRLLAALRDAGCAIGGVVRLAGYETPTKSRILAGGVHTRRQQIVRIDRGSPRGGELPGTARSRLRRAVARTIERAEGLLIADYGYGAASPGVAGAGIRRASRRGIAVTLDSRSRITGFPGITTCSPNQEEVEQALGLAPLLNRADLERAGRDLLERTAASGVLVTQGAAGMTLFERERPTVAVPAFGSDEVADVTGAGDTVIAVLTLALIAGASLADATRLANYAAGLVVMKAGTATIAPDELIDAIARDRT